LQRIHPKKRSKIKRGYLKEPSGDLKVKNSQKKGSKESPGNITRERLGGAERGTLK